MPAIRTARELLRMARRAEAAVYAAYAAYFMALSVFPGTLLAVGLLHTAQVPAQTIRSLVSGVVPRALLPLLDYMVEELYAGLEPPSLSLSAAAALWSASQGVYSICLGLNRVYGVPPGRRRLRTRLRCLGFTVLGLCVVALAGVLHLAGQELLRLLSRSEDPAARFLLRLIRARTPVTLLLLSAFFTVLYCAMPGRPVTVRSALPGAFGAAGGWMLFARAFSRYAEASGAYDRYYGSLSIMALAMLWLYVSMLLLFCGGVLNRMLEQRRSRSA